MTTRQLATLAWMVAALAGGVLAGDDDDLFSYRQELAQGRTRNAERRIRGLLRRNRSLTVAHRGRLNADLAGILRGRGDTDKALKLLAALPTHVRSASVVQLEMGRCFLASGEQDKALACFERCRRAPAPAVRCAALLERARIHFGEERYAPCIGACKAILATTAGKTGPDLAAVAAAARELLARAEAALLRAHLGEDYYHYCQGRRAQARGRFDLARREYGLIESGMLAAAGECYATVCCLKQGARREAERALRTFVASAPTGVYRGEAMLAVAYSRCIVGADWGKTIDLVDRAMAWIEAARTTEGAAKEELAKLQPVLAHAPPPADFAARDHLGNLVRGGDGGPDAVVNRVTCSWYLPRLRQQLLLVRCFAAFQAGDVEAAREQVAAAAALNRQHGEELFGNPDFASHLAAGIGNGAFLLPSLSWRTLSRTVRDRTRFACFLATAGEYDAASDLLAAARQQAAGRGGRDRDRAAIDYAVGICRFARGDQQAAAASLRQSLAACSRAPLAPAAALLLANLQAATEPEAALSGYAHICKRWPQSAAAPRALFAGALMQANGGDRQAAMRQCATLLKRYRDSACAKAGRTLAQWLQRGTGAHGTVALAGGRVVPVIRHVRFPGGGDLRYHGEETADGDLLFYEIVATTRASCFVLKQFSLRLTRFEPQLPPVKGHRTSFLRAPVLFN